MEFSFQDLISPESILTDVLMYTRNERFDKVTKGFLLSQMRKCLEELSYSTFFSEVNRSFPMPSNRILELPEKVFNIKQIYLYNGDKCNIANATNVYWKRNYFHTGAGYGVSRNKPDNNSDAFYGGNGLGGNLPYKQDITNDNSRTTSNSLFYYGYQQGNLYFSESCSKFSNILIKFNSIWEMDISKPCIPRQFRRVVVDWCVESTWRAMVPENPNVYRPMLADAQRALGFDENTFTGSWYRAKNLVARMGSKQKEDLQEYLSRLNY